MIDNEKRKAYMREYRRKNRARLTQYSREYLSDPEKAEKHREACRKYYRNSMSEEKRQKNREYQKEYYQRRKKEKSLW